MELSFQTTTKVRNDTLFNTETWLDLPLVINFLPQSVLVSFIALICALTWVIVRDKKIEKLISEGVSFTTKRRTEIQSISLFSIIKSFIDYGTDFQKIIEKAIEKHGEIFKLNLLGVYNIVFITNPSMVHKLCMSTEHGHLHKPKLYNKILVGPLQNGLQSLQADAWKLHRSVLAKAFTYRGLLRQLNIIEDHAKKFILMLQESCALSPSLNKPTNSFQQQVQTFTFDTISHIACGIDMHDDMGQQKRHFQENFERIKDLLSIRLSNPLNYVDLIWNCNPRKWEMDKRLNELNNYTDKIIARTRKQLESDAEDGVKTEDDMAGKSLVELMINAGFSNDEIFSEIATFCIVGQDTVSITISLLLFLLASHKEYQDKCRDEIDQMFDTMCASKSNELSMEDVNSLDFLDMCIKESMRLYSTIPVFGRYLETELQIDENTCLPKGSIVYTSPWIIHRNPKIYSEPEKFQPERFSPENVRKLGSCEYIPFSTGPRNCIGFKSAMIEVKVLVAHVLHNFEVRSEMSLEDLNTKLRKSFWPFPDLGLKLHARQ